MHSSIIAKRMPVALGGFTHCAFCAVVRPPDHPLRPAGYVPLDAFWTARGYAKVEGVVARIRLEGHRSARGDRQTDAVLDQGAVMTTIRIAAAQYPLEAFPTLADYRDKLARWVAEAAAAGAQLLVFPEYGAMEYAGAAAPRPPI